MPRRKIVRADPITSTEKCILRHLDQYHHRTWISFSDLVTVIDTTRLKVLASRLSVLVAKGMVETFKGQCYRLTSGGRKTIRALG